jgi:hypothetical protein
MDGSYAYIVDQEGHVINRVNLAFEKEEDAAEHAKRLVKPNSRALSISVTE